MNDIVDVADNPRWYHQIPNWAMAALMLFGALVAGVSAFGQVSQNTHRIDVIEPKVGALEGRMTSSEAHAQDEHDRLQRIEEKLDVVIQDKTN